MPEAALPELAMLGIAQDAGYPHVGCRRACCLPAWSAPHRRHRVSCIGLVDGEQGWLIDATPDLPAQLNVLAERGAALSGVLLTHGHIGHYTGLVYLGREGLSARRVPVYALPGMAGFIRDNAPWEQLIRLENIVLHEITAGQALALSPSLSVTPIRVPHRAEYTETVGYRIDGPRRSAVYIPDVDVWWPGVEALLAEVDLAFLDGTFFTADEVPDRDPTEVPHPPIADSLRRFAGLPAGVRARIRFTHLNHSNPALDPTSAQAAAVREAGMHIAAEGESWGL